MITKEKVDELLGQNLSLDHYYLLKTIHEKRPRPTNRKVKGFVQLLMDRGLIEKDTEILTQAALDLIREPVEPEVVGVVNTTFEVWTESLLIKLKGKLYETIGQSQIMGFGKVYFIPGLDDLREFLTRFFNKYKTFKGQWDNVEKVLLRHVETCGKKREFSPAVKYFIAKQGSGSQLAAALENFKDFEKEPGEEPIQTPVRNTKDLF